ncbi:MAG: hypothetical protein OQK24_02930 [Magnetovibrio sp.]|nr:hypothetical protein [Magnetovibrio sp.]
MCNALSPEKAVIWSVLQGLSADELESKYFRHPIYRSWFDAAINLQRSGQPLDYVNIERVLNAQGHCQSDANQRSLKRLLRITPPPRIRENAHVFIQSLVDIHHGRRVHIESLIN